MRRRSWFIVCLVVVVVTVVAIMLWGNRTDSPTASTSPTAPQTSTSVPSQQTVQSYRQLVAPVLRAYFLPLDTWTQETAAVQAATTDKMFRSLQEQWAGGLPDDTSVTMGEPSFPDVNLPHENRQYLLEACVDTTTRYPDSSEDATRTLVILTLIQENGWKVDSLEEMPGGDDVCGGSP